MTAVMNEEAIGMIGAAIALLLLYCCVGVALLLWATQIKESRKEDKDENIL